MTVTWPIKIFLSSPSDVLSEQSDVINLVSEINDVIKFISPHLDVEIEVIRYQDNTFPDLGRPQDVVDRHIPQDYDIHIGIMWMRCGTPTQTENSGTIHEFRQAAKRRNKTGRPIIMFYFSDEPPRTLPSKTDELDQLRRVLEFKEELQNIGLIKTYPSSTKFREHLRVGLLRAISDIIKSSNFLIDTAVKYEEKNNYIPLVVTELSELYEQARITMRGGPARTQLMTSIYSRMLTVAPSVKNYLGALQKSSVAGQRLFAIAILSSFPDREHLNWLSTRLDPELEKPFVGFQSGVAILQAVNSLSSEAEHELSRSIELALELAKRNPNDPPRIAVLKQAQQQLLQISERKRQ